MATRQLAIGNLSQIIDSALAEDIGPDNMWGDVTSQILIPNDIQADMTFVARDKIVPCGTFIPAMVYERLKASVKTETYVEDGQTIEKNEPILKISGQAQALLTGERPALNLIQRMSGIATLTRSYVNAVAGTKAIIIDTRKTMPGLRILDKYSVRAGGGKNHRMGLYDMVLIKDNHIMLSESITKAVEKARGETKLPIEVECDTLEQVIEAISAKPDRILLDNMDLETMASAVRLAGGRIPLEASGRVSLETVRSIAQTGVDYISIGKLTHSAPAADISAEIILTGTKN